MLLGRGGQANHDFFGIRGLGFGLGTEAVDKLDLESFVDNQNISLIHDDHGSSGHLQVSV